MKKITFLIIIASVFFSNVHNGHSQNTRPVTFQGKQIDMPPNVKSFKWEELTQRDNENSGYYVCLQFSATPNQQVQNDFRNQGIELRNYIANNTYFLYMPSEISASYLEDSGVISIVSMPFEFKVSSKIRNNEIGTWAKEGNNIITNVQFHKSIAANTVLSSLSAIDGVVVKEQFKGSNLMTVSIPMNKLNEIGSLSVVKWIELIQEPDVKEDNRGRSIHRSSNLDTQSMSGRNYTGEGVGVLVRDDGIVGPHIDFEGRIDNSAASGTGPTHGDGVAGILAGAGNLDPTKRGMAAGSNIFVVNYASSFLDGPTTSLINNNDVQITNSSYGNGCNAGYTSTSETVDTQANNNLSLLHVFSAGNSNNNDCGYGAGNQWGNITGGHKQGKNVIATANVFFNGVLAGSSSHGPAYDGRIKPDITAHGQDQLSTDENNGYLTFGGTSGAAPGIAGVSAQLYQLYKDQNGGAMPESALIKAALLNTANDYGNVGPDFKFGWGLVNGLRAAMLLEDNRYLADELTQGNNNNHTINVPANTKQVRFMLYWNDPAAVSGASSALINDLDLKVTSPSTTEFLPWVLDHTPNPTTLDLPATNGVDRLNNMEQVLINNPEAGDYTINIDGFNIPVGPQRYHIVYEIITEELTLTYPIGNEKLVSGERVPIHWDAINTTQSFVLEYSADNGATWNSIVTASSSSTNYDWLVPNVDSGECLVRITSGSFTDQSDAAFSIADEVSGISITQICPTDITVEWDAYTDATSYDVYLLGEKYMELVGTTSSTTLAVPITDPTRSFWVAVSAKGGANNWETRRSIAVNRSEGGLYNCPLSKDLTVDSVTNDFSNLNLICAGDNTVDIIATISNLGTDPQSNFTISYQLDNNTVVNETYTGTIASGNQETYAFTTPLEITQDGSHVLKVFVSLSGDEYVGNDEHQEAFYSQVIPETINNVEDFEVNAFPPPGWKTENGDNSTTWVPATLTNGADGQPTSGVGFDNYNYNAAGQEDTFITLVYDLNGTGLALNFDLAKAQYSSSLSDGLRVEISTDCGATYTTIYEKDGLDLSTLANYSTSNWSPSGAGDWRTEVVDLAAYQGEKVQIRFINVNGYGNSTFIDNINITGVLSTERDVFEDNFALYPNPTEDRFTIRSNKVDLNSVEVYNLLGKKVKTVSAEANNQIINVDVTELPSGVYVIRLKSELGTFYKKVIKS